MPKLPADFLSLSAGYKFLGTSKSALESFHDDKHEGRDIWDTVIDTKWLDSKHSDGYEIYLVGDIGKIRNPNPEDQDLVVALLMSGGDPYKAVRPKGLPKSRENTHIGKKYDADRKRVKKDIQRELLSALRSSDFREKPCEVTFPNFTVHVGDVLGELDFTGLERLLQPDKKHTLLLKYRGGPLPMQKADAKYDRGVLTIEKGGKRLAWFYDMDIDWRDPDKADAEWCQWVAEG